MSLSVLKDHCKVRLDDDNKSAFIIGGKGDTWRNGHRVGEDIEEKVAKYYQFDFLLPVLILCAGVPMGTIAGSV